MDILRPYGIQPIGTGTFSICTGLTWAYAKYINIGQTDMWKPWPLYGWITYFKWWFSTSEFAPGWEFSAWINGSRLRRWNSAASRPWGWLGWSQQNPKSWGLFGQKISEVRNQLSFFLEKYVTWGKNGLDYSSHLSQPIATINSYHLLETTLRPTIFHMLLFCSTNPRISQMLVPDLHGIAHTWLKL